MTLPRAESLIQKWKHIREHVKDNHPLWMEHVEPPADPALALTLVRYALSHLFEPIQQRDLRYLKLYFSTEDMLGTAQQFVVIRQSKPATLAVVTLEAKQELTATEARDRVAKAVTDWVHQTEAGAEAWRASARDFNVGDLACYQGDLQLRALLHKHGISRVYVRIQEFDSLGWEFDNILVRDP